MPNAWWRIYRCCSRITARNTGGRATRHSRSWSAPSSPKTPLGAMSNAPSSSSRTAGVLDAERLISDLSDAALAELIRPAGYFNVKARRLKALCQSSGARRRTRRPGTSRRSGRADRTAPPPARCAWHRRRNRRFDPALRPRPTQLRRRRLHPAHLRPAWTARRQRDLRCDPGPLPRQSARRSEHLQRLPCPHRPTRQIGVPPQAALRRVSITSGMCWT
jgi:hypothetical protein